MKVLCNDKIIAENVLKADTFGTRFIGLMNRKTLNMNEGLLLTDCSSIHCFFMKFTIDAVYLSTDMKVLYKETIKPWKIGKIVKGCTHILELAEGVANKVSMGDNIVLVE
ncbi:DUF192 domain-containing protein [Sedimentibacter sp.]|uniref:DUF192 domain-containing protein n=1 Tax=Sedimentibacter sp. TaxID=1960295 RepID=UPI0028AC459A|nr:DUF192 domain-containing protein [Sedimentibacter sp.]